MSQVVVGTSRRALALQLFGKKLLCGPNVAFAGPLTPEEPAVGVVDGIPLANAPHPQLRLPPVLHGFVALTGAEHRKGGPRLGGVGGVALGAAKVLPRHEVS